MWTAALIHRVSGVLLALFLPLHFLVLGLAIDSEARFDRLLKWSHEPLVKLAEAGLVALLVVHLVGGLRILVVELTPWRGNYNFVALVAFAGALVAGIVFLLRAA